MAGRVQYGFDVAFIFVTHNGVCHNATAGKEMSDWTPELDLKWAQLINHAMLFPHGAIICGGPASVMGWSDYRYDRYAEACVAQCLAAGVFAFDGKEYFSKMEMSWDDWHWASTDENRAVFTSMFREVTYMLSLTVLPQPWKIQ